MFGIVKVNGTSMSPEYSSGDFLFFIRFFKKFFIKNGRNVIVQHPKLGLIVKKIKTVDRKNKTITLKGNNSSSTYSGEMGVVYFQDILGFPLVKLG